MSENVSRYKVENHGDVLNYDTRSEATSKIAPVEHLLSILYSKPAVFYFAQTSADFLIATVFLNFWVQSRYHSYA